MNVDVKRAALAAIPKSPARIALVLDKSFTEYTHEMNMVGDKYVSPLGPALREYARNVTENRFGQVSVHASPEDAAGKVEAILIPKVAKFDESYGLWAGSPHNVVMIVEWSLKDRDNQRELWLDSIDARAEGKMGNVFSYKRNHRDLMQRLFEDLSIKTQKAFEHSGEINLLEND